MRIRKKRAAGTPRSAMSQQIVVPEKFRKAWSIISKSVKILLFCIGTAGFSAFIVEETMQVRGFGAYGLQQGKLWQEAARYSNECVDLLERDRRTLKILRWFNPLTGHIFLRYADAEEMKLQAQMKRIEWELKQLDRRVTLVEGKIETNHIKVEEEKPAAASLKNKERSQKLPVNAAIAYPKQIDYQTHNERAEAAQNQVVATKFGRRYHLKSCPSVAGKEVTIHDSREDAEIAGLSSCRRCRP